MKRPFRLAGICGVVLVTAGVLAPHPARAQAQVGYLPASSPYADLEYHQDVTAIYGWYHAEKDPLGVAPKSAPIMGLMYNWRAGGPAYLTGEVSRIGSERTVIDPLKPAATRVVGTRANPLYDLDISLGIALPGFRTWHELQPLVKAGAGLITDFKSPDVGGYNFGTRFAFSWGAGVRWVPRGRWGLRADIDNRLYTSTYPESYYQTPAGGGTPVLSTAQSRSQWTNNTALTLGIMWMFSR